MSESISQQTPARPRSVAAATAKHWNLVVWFAVLGGPLAWAAQFVANLFLILFSCNGPARSPLPVHTLAIAVGATGLVVALASSGVALWLYRATAADREMSHQVIRGFGGRPVRTARVHFLAIVGITVNFLVIAIIVMTTVGTPQLLSCQQS